MKKPVLIKDDFYWVGALDPDLRHFDIVMETEYGTTYNSYILKGSEKTALFETVKDGFFDEFLERLDEVVDPKDIDYIVLNHTEPDHAGSLERLLKFCPNATVVGTNMAITFSKKIANRDFDSLVVKEGDILDLGNKKLRFIMAPNLHWPDTMFSYIEEDNILVTCDSFGCHYCNELLFNDLIGDDFVDAYKYYFDMIMGPFKSFVIKALDKIKHMDIDYIAPGHGPIIRKDIPKYIDMYRGWADTPKSDKKSVVIAYVSAYGYTKKIANTIENSIKDENIDVFSYDLLYTDKKIVLEKIAEADGMLFGSPTLVGDALEPVMEVLVHLNPVIHKGKIAGAFGSYGWSGEAVPNIEARLKQLRLKMPVEGLKIRLNPNEEELELACEFGKKFKEALK